MKTTGLVIASLAFAVVAWLGLDAYAAVKNDGKETKTRRGFR